MLDGPSEIRRAFDSYGFVLTGNYLFDLGKLSCLDFPDIDIILNVQEVSVINPKVSAKSDGRICSDLPSVMKNILYPGYRHMYILRQSVCRYIKRRHEFLK